MIKVALRSVLILDGRGRSIVAWYSLVRILISLLDLIGVASVGLIVSVAVSGTSSLTVDHQLSRNVLALLRLERSSISEIVAYLGVATTIVFLLRLFLTYYFTRKTLQVLAKYEVRLADMVRQKLFFSGIAKLQENDSIKAAQIFTTGVSSAVRIIGMVVTALADVAASLGLIIVMGVASPLSMLGSALIFGPTTYFSLRHFGNRTEIASKQVLLSNLGATKKVQENYFAYRELVAGGHLRMSTEHAMEDRRLSSRMLVDAQFYAIAPRILLEATMLIVVVFVGSIIWVTNSSSESLTILGIFLTASSRFVPVIASLMANISAMRYASGEAGLFLDFFDENKGKDYFVQSQKLDRCTIENSKNSSVDMVSLVDVSFRYPTASDLLLSDVNMTIHKGDFIGVTGRSGEGKSTLVDLIIGVLEPTEGKILINGIRSVEFLENNPGVIAYVPQSCGLLDGSILENILYRKNYQEYELVEVINALKASRLWEFVSALPFGIQTNIGERGSLLSGGQKQRLGIARGLFQKSSLIVLDESTNALDSHTESQIYEILNDLRGEITVIIIGHNFETIKLNANKLFLVENGTVTELSQQ